MSRRMGALLLCASLMPIAAGCASAPPPGVVYVSTAPPVAVVEVPGVTPGPDYVWIHGHHRWTGTTYVWGPGRWEKRPRANAVWHDGAWVHHSRGWYWREGHW